MLNWRVPRGEWSGSAAHILGGGASLRGFDASVLEGERVIGINEAGLTLAPWCDILFWADTRWLEWNVDRLHLHTGERKVCRQSPFVRTHGCSKETARRVARAVTAHGILHLPQDRRVALSEDAGRVAGIDSGASAINLAWLLGAAPIYLHGFDMTPGHYHDRHPVPSRPERYASELIPGLRRMAKMLEARGAVVINCTPGSALDCFPAGDLDEVLGLTESER